MSGADKNSGTDETAKAFYEKSENDAEGGIVSPLLSLDDLQQQ